MKGPRKTLLASSILAIPSLAHALGLGGIEVKSGLNEPLNAEIQVIQAAPGEADGLAVALASAEDFARVGIDRARMDMPLSFHVLTSGMTKSFIEGRNALSGAKQTAAELRATGRGPSVARTFGTVRNCQDILSMFVFGRVFERHPDLKLVCVEADAGWAPHYMYRMDHYYRRHRHWQGFPDMEKLPSEYFKENIYLTFQDDWSAFQVAHLMNPKRLMWANDFPHSDSTWPWSQELLAEHSKHLSAEERAWILRDNCAELYGIDVVR